MKLELLLIGPTSDECGGGLRAAVERQTKRFSLLCSTCNRGACGDDPAWCWEHTDAETRERIEKEMLDDGE